MSDQWLFALLLAGCLFLSLVILAVRWFFAALGDLILDGNDTE